MPKDDSSKDSSTKPITERHGENHQGVWEQAEREGFASGSGIGKAQGGVGLWLSILNLRVYHLGFELHACIPLIKIKITENIFKEWERRYTPDTALSNLRILSHSSSQEPCRAIKSSFYFPFNCTYFMRWL